jgi:hypothetical protein
MTPAELEAHFANWTPTAENINALPRPLREYIHRLEANTDPGGNVQKAAVLEEQLRALQKLIEEGPR